MYIGTHFTQSISTSSAYQSEENHDLPPSMKSTKVQNPRRILHILHRVDRVLCTIPMHVLGNWPCLACSCNVWCCQFSLQHRLAASVGMVLGKVECC